jgi:hypothetical protein
MFYIQIKKYKIYFINKNQKILIYLIFFQPKIQLKNIFLPQFKDLITCMINYF